MTNEQGAIEERLENLERQNRRMKLAGLGAMVIAGAFVLMGQARLVHPSTITATKFVLVDSQGRQRATLDMYKGSPILGLFDANGNMRVVLSALPEGPGLALSDAKGNTRAEMDAFSDSPELALSDAKGNTRVMLSALPEGPGLALYDAKGNTRAGMDAFSDRPELALSDASGFVTDIGVTGLVTPATGETHKTSAASIVLFGKDRKVLWSAPPQN
jgi:hypothetical protein